MLYVAQELSSRVQESEAIIRSKASTQGKRLTSRQNNLGDEAAKSRTFCDFHALDEIQPAGYLEMRVAC